jgi:hypothetical protein
MYCIDLNFLVQRLRMSFEGVVLESIQLSIPTVREVATTCVDHGYSSVHT